MTKPTRDHIKAMQQTLERDGVEYLYPFEVKELLTAYLSQEEELDQLNADLRYYKSVTENQTGLKLKLQAENQALRDQVSAIKRAIIDEPELPGPMPEGMIETIATVGIEEVLRVVVRETKKGILWRAKL